MIDLGMSAEQAHAFEQKAARTVTKKLRGRCDTPPPPLVAHPVLAQKYSPQSVGT